MPLTLIAIASTLLMFPIMMLCNQYYRVPIFKLFFCAVMLTITGVLGGSLMYFIENGRWGNQSFYGAILFAPLMMYFVAKTIGVSTSAIVDMCAPTGCVFLALQKLVCLHVGCCAGRVIAYAENGDPIRFPSQILECAAALLICILLYWLISQKRYQGKILPIFLITYGIIRYGLNLTRETTPFFLGLAAGNFWSIVAIILGISLLILIHFKKKGAA